MEPATIWTILPSDEAKYEAIYSSLNPNPDGKLTGEQVRPVLLNSNLPPNVLASIWELSDVDKDGCLGKREMCIALHLVYKCLQNTPIPQQLPYSLATYFRDGQRQQTSSAMSADREVVTALSNMNMNASQTSIASGSRSSSITGDWPLNPILYKAQFDSCDSDHDGLTTGADLRNFLLSSGLPQNDLAQIWELADVNKNGMMNLEQFTLLMYLLEERKRGKPIFPSLPYSLVPPSLRSASRPPTTDISGHSNEEIDKLNAEIENLAKERNNTENQLIQLDADMTIKNSEIKNLQLELSTLEKTADQLKRQKMEAGKRLNDLDGQLNVHETAVTEQTEKLAAEELRLQRIKEAIAESAKNLENEREALAADRQKLAGLEREKQALQAELDQKRRTMESVTNELSDMDGDIKKFNTHITQMSSAKEQLATVLKDLREALSKEDLGDVHHLLTDFRSIMLPNSVSSPVASIPSVMNSRQNSIPKPAADPFGGDPFADSNVDPFGSKAFADPFKSNEDPFTNDPFGAATPSSDDFANFANFQ